MDELRAQREALFEARRAYAKTPDKTPDIRMETPDMWETPDKPRTRVESTQDVVGVCGCGTPLVRGMRGPVPRYCSDACRKREARKRG